MAKLSAHGAEIGRIEYSDHRKAYMADGKVLKDYGHGWKLSGKLKAGWTPPMPEPEPVPTPKQRPSVRQPETASAYYSEQFTPL